MISQEQLNKINRSVRLEGFSPNHEEDTTDYARIFIEKAFELGYIKVAKPECDNLLPHKAHDIPCLQTSRYCMGVKQ